MGGTVRTEEVLKVENAAAVANITACSCPVPRCRHLTGHRVLQGQFSNMTSSQTIILVQPTGHSKPLMLNPVRKATCRATTTMNYKPTDQNLLPKPVTEKSLSRLNAIPTAGSRLPDWSPTSCGPQHKMPVSKTVDILKSVLLSQQSQMGISTKGPGLLFGCLAMEMALAGRRMERSISWRW